MNRSLRALAHKGYLLIWIGSLLSNIGNWVQNVAEGWIVSSLTHSAFLVELISFAQFIPVIFLVIPAGIIADRYNRKVILILAQTTMCAVAITLAIAAHNNALTPYFLIGMIFIEGAAWALGGPAWHTVIPSLVPRKDLESAISLNSIQFNLARLIGPAIAGVLMSKYGNKVAFDVNALSFLAVIAAIVFVKIKEGHLKTNKNEAMHFSQGWNWIVGHKGANRILWSMVFFAVLSAPIQGLMAFFATDVFHIDPRGLGTLFSCLGAGAVTGAYLLGVLPQYHPRHILIPISFIILGILQIIYSQVRDFHVACALIFLSGIFWLWIMVSCNTALQLLVPDRIRGRVMSVLLMGHVGMLPIGHILAGLFAQKHGPSITMLLCALGLLSVGLYTLWQKIPEIDLAPDHSTVTLPTDPGG